MTESKKRKRHRRKKYFTSALHHSQGEFSRRTGLSRTTIWRMRRTGKLRAVQLTPTLIRIPVSEYGRLGFELTNEPEIIETATTAAAAAAAK